MKITYRLTALALAAALFLPAGLVTSVSAAESMLYEDKKTQTVTAGVLYDEVTRMYDRGWLRFFALRIDLKNPNVILDVLENTDELGVKSTVGEFARVHNSVAAVNGDFFGSTAVSTSMGIVIDDGKLMQTRNYYNADKPSYAGIYIDNNDNPFIDYLKVTYIGFLTNGTSKLEIDAKNKVTDMKKPVYIDRSAMMDTAKLDTRFKDLYKIVVDGGRIVDISAGGATKTVPENGFLIVMNGPTAVEHLKNFSVGDEAKYTENYQFMGNSGLRAENIKFGISGGSKILENGETRDNGLIIDAQKRHPRTVVGINKEKTELIIIAIDGRSGDSIGATHWEAAEILREYGAWDAFHLDGGGSATLFARNEGQTSASLQNAPSGGQQRKIPNAIGVSSANTEGSLAGLYVFADGKRDGAIAMATQPVTLAVSGYDTNHNPVSVSGVTFTQEGAKGLFNGNSFTPQEEGVTIITATSPEGFTESVSVRALSKPTALRVTPRAFTLNPDDSIQLKAELINKDGYGIDITKSTSVWSVTGGIGHFEGTGLFKAGANGTGSVSVSYGSYIGTAWAAVGSYTDTLLDFETADNVTFTGSNGSVAYTNTVKHDGQHSLQVNYGFKEGVASAQTAAIDFRNARATIEKPPNSFGFFLTGDAAGSAVSASFSDGAGNEHVFSFPTKMDNGDWKYYYQRFPVEGLPLPLKLNFITITSVENLKAPVNAKVFLDTLQVSYDNAAEASALKTDLYGDYMQQDMSMPEYADYSTATEITVFGPTAYAKTETELSAFERVLMKMQQNSNLAVFAGYTNTVPQLAPAVLKWSDTYGVKDLPDVRIITLGTSKGGMRQTSPQQWKNLASDLENCPYKNVIIVMNKDIWDKNYGFADNKERDLLHKTLKEFREKTGANVIVAAGISPDTKGYLEDGIRYITLNGLVTAGSASPEYNILRIRVNGDTMRYDLERID